VAEAAVMLAILTGAGAAWLFAVRADRERARTVTQEFDANAARDEARTATKKATEAGNAARDSAEGLRAEPHFRPAAGTFRSPAAHHVQPGREVNRHLIGRRHHLHLGRRDSWPKFAPDGRAVISQNSEGAHYWSGETSGAVRTIARGARFMSR
jgi:hypothetical protein